MNEYPGRRVFPLYQQNNRLLIKTPTFMIYIGKYSNKIE
jgi:hypothetical protein